MVDYKPGDLAKLMETANAFAVPLPDIKVKTKLKVKKTNTGKTVQPDTEGHVSSKNVSKEDMKPKSSTKKLKVQMTQEQGKKRKKNMELTEQGLEVTTRRQTVEKSLSMSIEGALPKKKVKTTLETGTDIVEPPKKKKKKKGNVMENKQGFNPPSGIVHESLVKKGKKKKRPAEASVEDEDDVKEVSVNEETEDTEGDGSPAKKAKLTKKEGKKRLRKDRLFKKTDDRTVFVGNLSLEVKKKRLTKLFKKFGEIESVRFRCVPVSNPKLPKRAIAIKREFHPERNNYSAFVQFKDQESANKALENNGLLVKNMHIRVDMACREKSKDTKKSVFVGNLPFDIEEEKLWSHFEDCGKVENVRLIRDPKTSLGKGFGYVTFADQDGVAFAMKLDGTSLAGRKLRIQHCTAEAGEKKNIKDKNTTAGKKGGGKMLTPATTARNSKPFQGEKSKKDMKQGKKKKMKNSQKVFFDIKDKAKGKDTKEESKPEKNKGKKAENGKPNELQKAMQKMINESNNERKELQKKTTEDKNKSGDGDKSRKEGHKEAVGKPLTSKSLDGSNVSQNVTKYSHVVKKGTGVQKPFNKKTDFPSKRSDKKGQTFNFKTDKNFQNKSFDRKEKSFKSDKNFQHNPKPFGQNRSFDYKSTFRKDRPSFGTKKPFNNQKPGPIGIPRPGSLPVSAGKHIKFDD